MREEDGGHHAVHIIPRQDVHTSRGSRRCVSVLLFEYQPFSPMSETLPPEVRKLVLEHIHSVDQLDVLLLCHRTRDREWTAREVADELRTNLQMSSAALSDLSYR